MVKLLSVGMWWKLKEKLEWGSARWESKGQFVLHSTQFCMFCGDWRIAELGKAVSLTVTADKDNTCGLIKKIFALHYDITSYLVRKPDKYHAPDFICNTYFHEFHENCMCDSWKLNELRYPWWNVLSAIGEKKEVREILILNYQLATNLGK